MIIQTNASKKGWEQYLKEGRFGGRWTTPEALKHINLLEL